jgi:O-methyltransferase
MSFLFENIKLIYKLEKLKPGFANKVLSALISSFSEKNEYLSYQAAEMISSEIYPKYKFSEYARIYLEDEDFVRYYESIMDLNNWHSLDRKYTLNELLKLCLKLDGDLVECGTYKGASAYLMCKMFAESPKLIHIFDSFEGLSTPNEKDGEYWSNGSLSVSERYVGLTLDGFKNYRLYKGWIPDRFNEVLNNRFCFVHIDVDLYEPTINSLIFFYDKVVKGGVILLDDYGFKTCPGAKEASDLFFRGKEPIIKLPTGQAFVIKQ